MAVTELFELGLAVSSKRPCSQRGKQLWIFSVAGRNHDGSERFRILWDA